ncbi:hypothetical protein JCM19238_2553 [Vibrio ponticus]|nr:hypothetical protein JCM19238_2553 [Vibrio ponticus]
MIKTILIGLAALYLVGCGNLAPSTPTNQTLQSFYDYQPYSENGQLYSLS